jgi:hypothetical protein
VRRYLAGLNTAGHPRMDAEKNEWKYQFTPANNHPPSARGPATGTGARPARWRRRPATVRRGGVTRLGAKTMSFRFIGESLRELRAHAPADRRRVYFRAVRASYRSWKTWLGLVALVVLVASGDPAVRVLVGLICMGALQVWAIQDALRNMKPAAPPSDPQVE